MPKHGSVNLYVHGNQKARYDGQPRMSTSTLTQLLSTSFIIIMRINNQRETIMRISKRREVIIHKQRETISARKTVT